jgi:hypothetical protein
MRKRPAVSAGVLGAAGPAGAAGSAAPITPADPSTPASLALLVDLTGLSEQLCRSLAAGDWTNAFLAAGGMNQIAEDYLSGASALASRTHVRALTHPRARRWQAEVAGLCVDLASVVIGQPVPMAATEWPQRGAALRDGLAHLPVRARRDILRPPSCFSRFDQRPEDALAIARLAAARVPTQVPILVLGVRTSGSYLAPLQAAALAGEGFADVHTATIRPGQRAPRPVVRSLKRLGASQGRVIAVHNAPRSGEALRQVLDELRRRGMPDDAVTLAFALPPETYVPESLAGYDALILPWDSWSIVRRLEPEQVTADLAELRGPDVRVIATELVSAASAGGATPGHVEAAYSVDLAGSDCEVWTESVAVEGCGFGFFGTRAVAVARARGGAGAKVHGVRDGLLYREWLPPDASVAKLPATWPRQLAEDLAGQIAERARALSLPSDPTPALGGRGTVVEVASEILANACGRSASPVRATVLERVVGRLLEVRHPAVIDGSTWLDQWHLVGRDRAVKVGRAMGETSGLICFDPVYDLAGVTALADDPEFEAGLRAAYLDAAGEPVDDERWLLYLLVQLWAARRRVEAGREIDRLSSLAIQRYLARRVLGDAVCLTDGPLCAFDLDGLVEPAAPGWPMPTPRSVLSLRTLMVHGFRPVPVSGRSVAHVRDLCITFGLPGGAAEHGAVLYERGDEQVIDLVRRETSASVRVALAARPGVAVDPDYRVVVRATGLRRAGRGPLEAPVVTDVLDAYPGLSAIRGDAQTDFVPRGVDKGKGLARLARLLGHGPAGDGPAPIAAAVGDSGADVPMFEHAEHAFLVGPAGRSLRRSGITALRRGGQRGLSDAVSVLVGHRPGGCPRCAPAPLDRRGRQLLSILDAPGR